MFLNNYKNLGKIFLVLVLAYFMSSFSVKNVFLVNSPKIRPNLGSYLLARINNVKENMLARLNFSFLLPQFNQEPNNNLVANQNREEAINFLKNSLKPVTKGVSAAEENGYSYTEFKLDEIEWAKITYTLKNGQTVTIQYPKGTEPPPQAIYESQREE